MAEKSAGDVRFGGAYVELYTDQSKLPFEMQKAERTIESGANKAGSKWAYAFNKSAWMDVAKSPMIAAFAAAAGTVGASVKHFESIGTSIKDIAAVTGLSTEGVSKLRLAFGSLDRIPVIFKGMSMFMLQLRNGAQDSFKVLSQIGIRYKDIANLAPEDLFNTLYYRIASIKDNTVRSGVAMRVFGEQAIAMLPVMAKGAGYIKEWSAFGERNNLIFSREDVNKADEIGEAFKHVKAAAEGWVLALGKFAGPAVTKALDAMSSAMGGQTAIEKEKSGPGFFASLGKYAPQGSMARAAYEQSLKDLSAGASQERAAKGMDPFSKVMSSIQGGAMGFLDRLTKSEQIRQANFAQSQSVELLNTISPQSEMDRIKDAIVGNSERETLFQSIKSLDPSKRTALLNLANRAYADSQKPEITTSVSAFGTTPGVRLSEMLGSVGQFNVQEKQLEVQKQSKEFLKDIAATLKQRTTTATLA